MTVVITAENRHLYAEALFNPRETKDPGQRWTQSRRADMEQFIAQNNGSQPVTILNLNTFPLKINGGMLFPDEIPGCPLGEPYTVFVIDKVRWTHRDIGSDANGMMQMDPVAIIPMVQAAEYIREYAQQGDGFGGVICYIGDEDPSSFKKDKVVEVPEVAFNAQGVMYVERKKRGFHEILSSVKNRRNSSIMRRLQRANNWHEVEAHRINIDDTYRADARLALQEGLIDALPSWTLHANTEMGKSVDPCPSCQVVPKAGAIICVNCGYLIDVVETFRQRPSSCVYGSAEMDRLTPEQWKIVDKIHAERTEARSKRKGVVTQ